MGRGAVMKTGLNDVSVIVWAISEFFVFFSSFFGILTNNYSIYNYNLLYEICDKNRPKQCQMCCLGHK